MIVCTGHDIVLTHDDVLEHQPTFYPQLWRILVILIQRSRTLQIILVETRLRREGTQLGVYWQDNA